METTAHITVLEEHGRALADAARGGGDVAVPSCPGWAVDDLVGHIGRVHRWVIAVLRSWTMQPMRLRDHTEEPPPPAQRLAWYEQGHQTLCSTLRQADLSAEIWTWTGQRAATFWARRMAHETAMHRWDAESAYGPARAFDGAFAVDGIDEVFDVFLPHHPGCSGVRGSGQTLHLHCTDSPGEWLVRFHDGGADVSRVHAKGDAAVRASASDLLLLLWGRRGIDGLDVFGDAAVVRLWTEAVKI